jgi:hypothetical protein
MGGGPAAASGHPKTTRKSPEYAENQGLAEKEMLKVKM